QQAIKFYELAAKAYAETDQNRWAATQNNLGIAYSSLPSGDIEKNLKNAVDAYQAALRVFSKEEFPSEWAATQCNLGNAYGDLATTGDIARNLKNAVAAYQAALRVYTQKDSPIEWATTQYNLGILYARQPVAV